MSSVARLNLSMLHLFVADSGSNVSQLLPSSIIFKMFSKRLVPREQRKLLFYIRFFFLFAGDEVKTNDLKYFDINISVKNCAVGTVIYLLERI